MSKLQFPNKILWLASYPKSGNTWFRAFLTALINEGEVEINNMVTDGIFSLRSTFEYVTDLDSREMYDEEVKVMIPEIYRHIAAEANILNIIKVHDFFGQNTEGKNIIPEDVTYCAIYFIRNPLDIAGSLANHNHSSIEAAVNKLNDRNSCLVRQPNNLNHHIQFRQYLSDWSSHVRSWTSVPTFPVYVVRYEDMLTDPFNTFSNVLRDIGWEYPAGQILKAIEATTFDRLSKQEMEKGFVEKAPKSKSFFRKGTMQNWERELSQEQISKIKSFHREIMGKYKY